MTLEQSVFSRTTTFGETQALIATRCYPLSVPQDAAKPALAYQLISNVPVRGHDGFGNLSRSRVQFSCVANSYEGAKALAVALRHCWESFRGTVLGVRLAAWVENEFDAAPESPVRRLDVIVWHNEV